MSTITTGTVIFSNTKTLNKFGNYQLVLQIHKEDLDDDLKAKVKEYTYDDGTVAEQIRITSKYPITVYDANNQPYDKELGSGTELKVKLYVDKRFSAKGSVRLEVAKIVKLAEYVSKAEKGLAELDADLPF